MNILISSAVGTFVLFQSSFALAGPVDFYGCSSQIVTEKFISCADGEGGMREPCTSKTTLHGTVTVALRVDTSQKSTTANLIYTPKDLAPVSMNTTCQMDTMNWMSCVTLDPVSALGHLEITFNIDGIKKNVYFVQIFADATNAPVGGFQTELDCRRVP